VTQNLAVVAVPTLPDLDLVLVLAQDPDLTLLKESTRKSTPNPEVTAEALQRTAEIIKRRAEREALAQAKEAVEAVPEAAEARVLAVTKEVADPVPARAEKKMEKEKKILILNKL
jgi:hypothetical protein